MIYRPSIQIMPTVFRLAITRNLFAFVFVVEVVVISDFFPGKNISICKENHLQFKDQII